MPKTVVVVPCYNEEKRLDPAQVSSLLGRPDLHVLFVNDGSRDATLAMLRRLEREHERVSVLDLETNAGKAEAVRRGLIEALDSGADVVGYLDADFATPPGEALAMLEEFDRTDAQVLMGSRVRLLGRKIERDPLRHYLGRIFATVASWSLRLSVYDTQCGAKLFRRGDALSSVLVSPFESRWAFDVELLARLTKEGGLTASDFVEFPLREWRDRAGSKLTARAMLRAGVDLLRIGVRNRLDRD